MPFFRGPPFFSLSVSCCQREQGSSLELSDDTLASIADLDDHPVEDNDEARADRMLSALESIPEDERQGLGLDVEVVRSKPLAERLVKLEELWTVRQQELREAYDAMPKVNELLTRRIEVLEDASATEDALIVALADLEDLLSDIDMARDFHTIGGFPTLASMLRDSHPESIREMAAWVIGTAVKNEPEHQLWVLEVRQRTGFDVDHRPPWDEPKASSEPTSPSVLSNIWYKRRLNRRCIADSCDTSRNAEPDRVILRYHLNPRTNTCFAGFLPFWCLHRDRASPTRFRRAEHLDIGSVY